MRKGEALALGVHLCAAGAARDGALRPRAKFGLAFLWCALRCGGTRCATLLNLTALAAALLGLGAVG